MIALLNSYPSLLEDASYCSSILFFQAVARGIKPIMPVGFFLLMYFKMTLTY